MPLEGIEGFTVRNAGVVNPGGLILRFGIQWVSLCNYPFMRLRARRVADGLLTAASQAESLGACGHGSPDRLRVRSRFAHALVMYCDLPSDHRMLLADQRMSHADQHQQSEENQRQCHGQLYC